MIFPNQNDIFRDKRNGKLYIYLSGSKRWMPNMQILTSWIPYYNPSIEKDFSSTVIDTLPTGSDMQLKNNIASGATDTPVSAGTPDLISINHSTTPETTSANVSTSTTSNTENKEVEPKSKLGLYLGVGGGLLVVIIVLYLTFK
jgi:hypothetical protein